MQTQAGAVKNILVIRNDRFGEFLLNIPALRALKESFPGARITAVTDPRVKELAGSVPFIDDVICWEIKRHYPAEIFKFIKLLRKKRFDVAVILNPLKELHIITALSGIPVRVGYDRKWGFLLTHKMQDKKYLAAKHEVEYNLELVGLIGAKTQDLTLSLNVNNDIIEKSEILKDLLNFNPEERSDEGSPDLPVAIHPWTSDPVKQWPVENFFELARRIAQDLGIRVVLVGAKEKGQAGWQLSRGLEDKIIDITGETTLRQLAAVLKKCRLLISGDSGPVHLACAVNTRVLAIFRNDIPGKTARRWGPWGDANAVIEKNNLYDITVDEVFDKVKVMLN